MLDTYNIMVSDRATMKKEKDGTTSEYFTVQARSNNNETNYPKVEVTYRDFKSLEVALSNNLRSNDIECPQLEKESSGLDMSSMITDRELSLNEKINNIKRFCKALACDPALHLEPFYDFFKIPKPDDENMDMSRLSEVEESAEKFRATINKPENVEAKPEFDKSPTIEYSGYFLVTVKGHHEKEDRPDEITKTHNYYTFEIRPVSDPDSSYEIEKRYSEFYDLVIKLKTQVKARPSALPPKVMIKDKQNLQKRGEVLEDWLGRILNHRLFFCTELFEFIQLDKKLTSAYLNLDVIAALLNCISFKLSVVSHKSFQNSDESFLSFEIRVDSYDSVTKDLVDNYSVFRRFKEFDHLHNELKVEFHKFSNPLPDLPGKLSYLNILSSSKTDQRQLKLDVYVTKLSGYSNIYHSIGFRKFLGLTTQKIDALIAGTKSHKNK